MCKTAWINVFLEKHYANKTKHYFLIHLTYFKDTLMFCAYLICKHFTTLQTLHLKHTELVVTLKVIALLLRMFHFQLHCGYHLPPV